MDGTVIYRKFLLDRFETVSNLIVAGQEETGGGDIFHLNSPLPPPCPHRRRDPASCLVENIRICDDP